MVAPRKFYVLKTNNSFLGLFFVLFFFSEGSFDMNATNCFEASELNCPEGTDGKYVAVDKVFAVLTITVNFFTCPLIVLLNTLIIIAVGKKRRLQTAHTTFCWQVCCQPVFITREIFRISGGSTSMYYKLLQTLFATVPCLCLVSLLHLTLIAFERFLATKYSLRYESIVTKFRVTMAAVCFWLVWLCHRVARRAVPDLPVNSPHTFMILCIPVIILCHVSVYLV